MMVQFGSIWLAGDPGSSPRRFSETCEFQTEGKRLEQVINRVRSQLGEPVDRQNNLQVVRFTVKRSFATQTDGEAFALTHIGAILAAGRQTATYTLFDGSTTKTMLKSLCIARQVPVDGTPSATVIISYEITGQPAT